MTLGSKLIGYPLSPPPLDFFYRSYDTIRHTSCVIILLEDEKI